VNPARCFVFTFATVVAVVNSVVGGRAIAIALGAIADSSLGVTAGVGGIAGLISQVALLRCADRLLEERAGRTESIFLRRSSALRLRAISGSGSCAHEEKQAAPMP
jgi:hypothetical protein